MRVLNHSSEVCEPKEKIESNTFDHRPKIVTPEQIQNNYALNQSNDIIKSQKFKIHIDRKPKSISRVQNIDIKANVSKPIKSKYMPSLPSKNLKNIRRHMYARSELKMGEYSQQICPKHIKSIQKKFQNSVNFRAISPATMAYPSHSLQLPSKDASSAVSVGTSPISPTQKHTILTKFSPQKLSKKRSKLRQQLPMKNPTVVFPLLAPPTHLCDLPKEIRARSLRKL
jgi:hypothetical protein